MAKVTMTLRLDKETHDELVERAKDLDRSFNAQVNYDLKTLAWTDRDMLDFALQVVQRKDNPPYILEDIRIVLKRELKKFKTS